MRVGGGLARAHMPAANRPGSSTATRYTAKRPFKAGTAR